MAIYKTICMIACAATLAFAGASHAAELTVGVSTTPLSTPFYVAEKYGFFAQEGIEVTLRDCVGGKLCMEQMLLGQVDLATASDLPIVLNGFYRKDYSVIASFSSTSRDVKLIALKGSGVKAIRDLPGKRVALTRGAAAEYFVDLMLLTNGLDPNSITIVDTKADEMEQTAKSRKADVFAGFEPGSFRLMRALKGDALVLDTPAIYNLNFNLISLKSTARDKGADMVKLLRALDKAIAFIQDNPAKTQAILLDRFKVDASFIGWAWNDFRFELGLNQSLLTTLESQARWAMREHVVKAAAIPNFLDLIEPSLLTKAKPAAVTIVK